MADQVVDATAGFARVIVSSAPEVVAWAAERGLACIGDPGTLDAAADSGRDWARARDAERVIVVHADLPFARDLHAVEVDAGSRIVVIVPDVRGDGTPVLSVPADLPFRFAYGPGSFARHREEAERVGCAVRVVRDDALGFDVDVPADLDRLGLRAAPRS